MGAHMFMFILFIGMPIFISSVAPQEIHSHNQHEISIAIAEMQRANYFAFVMLINMISPFHPMISGNITFLMPNDRMLAKSVIPENSVFQFLLRHSIPSPLPFENLNLFPNGSTIPSSLPNYSFEISNGGRTNYYLNNAKIISRNICTLGSIKCHGIDSVLSVGENNSHGNNHTFPFISGPSNNNNNSPPHVSSPLQPSPPLIPPAIAPSPSDHEPSHSQKSESLKLYNWEMLELIVTLLVVSAVGASV